MIPLSFETPDGRCLHCGTHVTSRFCRVFGDEQRRVHRCTQCDTHVRISKGSAAGLDVDVPDPEVSEGRHGGEPA
ncbi:hypothetical protein C2R22_02385 [Salinigranum rubrum]|uniref:Small CPxCG-related zinc finger protein n=1 Tax=Salinigranum rubrum TaxID=755307 RepID=A0A2I8VFD1_9EURY|nr:hypothetical protein C2R22_02385 [Salinigranum rubrum]